MSGATIRPVTGVDTHAHVFGRGLMLAQTRRYTPDYDATLEDYLANLSRNRMSHGVLVQPSFLGTDNSFMCAALRRHRDRLRGVAMVEPGIGDAALDELEHDGVVGIRFNLIGLALPDYRSAPWTTLLLKLERRNLFVEIHRGARDLAAVVPPLVDAGLRVVVDHFGRTDPQLGLKDPGFHWLLEAGGSGRIWVKLSGSYRNNSGEAQSAAMTVLLREAYGTGRLLWGSDWPHTQFETGTDYDAECALIRRLLPDAAERHAVLVDTPANLYRIARAETPTPFDNTP